MSPNTIVKLTVAGVVGLASAAFVSGWRSNNTYRDLIAAISESRSESAARDETTRAMLKELSKSTKEQINALAADQMTVTAHRIWAYELERQNRDRGIIVPNYPDSLNPVRSKARE